MTILVPAASNASITVSISRVGAGIEARRRLVEEQHLRLQRPGARQRERAAARRRRARAPAGRRACDRPTRCERLGAPGARARARATPAQLERIGRRWRSAERRSITGRWNTIAWRRRAPRPGPDRSSRCARPWARAGRAGGAAARSCRRRWRRGCTVRGPAPISTLIRSMMHRRRPRRHTRSRQRRGSTGALIRSAAARLP